MQCTVHCSNQYATVSPRNLPRVAQSDSQIEVPSFMRRLPIPERLKVWTTNLPHVHHQGACQTCRLSGPTLDQLNLNLNINKVPRCFVCKFTALAHWIYGPSCKANLWGFPKVSQRSGWWKWRSEVAKTFPSSFNWKRYLHEYSVGWKFQIDTPLVSTLCVEHSEKI